MVSGRTSELSLPNETLLKALAGLFFVFFIKEFTVYVFPLVPTEQGSMRQTTSYLPFFQYRSLCRRIHLKVTLYSFLCKCQFIFSCNLAYFFSENSLLLSLILSSFLVFKGARCVSFLYDQFGSICGSTLFKVIKFLSILRD